MHIFIDEAGTFTVTDGKPSPSVVGALIIPHFRIPDIERRYAKLRPRLIDRKNGDVKGRQLNEKQIATVVELLRRNDVIFDAQGFDGGRHTEEEVRAHHEEAMRMVTDCGTIFSYR
jgi:hypothetical protein